MGPLLSSITILPLSGIASAPVVAKQLIGFDDAPAGAGDLVKGVAQYDAKTGDAFEVGAIGVFDLIAGAAITKGDKIQSDAASKPIPLNGGETFAIALTSAVNPGDVVKVLIK